MAFDFTNLRTSVSETEEWLKKEYFSIRTGRATPTVLDAIRIDSYGAKLSLTQVANIGIENARTLRIVPYDSSQSKEIEKAIAAANLGLSVSAQESGVRVSFPELTSENRTALAKVVKEKLEQARVSLRSERDDLWSTIQKLEKKGEITEDDKYRFKDDMQKIIDAGNQNLDAMAEKKEKEILN